SPNSSTITSCSGIECTIFENSFAGRTTLPSLMTSASSEPSLEIKVLIDRSESLPVSVSPSWLAFTCIPPNTGITFLLLIAFETFLISASSTILFMLIFISKSLPFCFLFFQHDNQSKQRYTSPASATTPTSSLSQLGHLAVLPHL